MNREVSMLTLGSLAALRSDAGSAPVAVVQVEPELAQAYRWRPANTQADDARHIIRPDSIAPSSPGRWVLTETVSLERSAIEGFFIVAVPIAGDRALVAHFDGWRPIGVTADAGVRKVWLIRELEPGG